MAHACADVTQAEAGRKQQVLLRRVSASPRRSASVCLRICARRTARQVSSSALCRNDSCCCGGVSSSGAGPGAAGIASTPSAERRRGGEGATLHSGDCGVT